MDRWQAAGASGSVGSTGTWVRALCAVARSWPAGGLIDQRFGAALVSAVASLLTPSPPLLMQCSMMHPPDPRHQPTAIRGVRAAKSEGYNSCCPTCWIG